jgi:hypothetical protein
MMWPRILGDCLVGPHISPARAGGGHYLNFLLTHLGIVLSVRVFARGFGSTVLHHITAAKCVSGCPKIILVAGVDTE